MKVKVLLKFYFNAEYLNDRLNGLIGYHACRPDGQGFGRVLGLIEDKRILCNLMNYLESKFAGLAQKDITALKKYALLRVGIRRLEDGDRREIKRAVMKLARRLTFIGRHEEEVRVLQKYRALLSRPCHGF